MDSMTIQAASLPISNSPAKTPAKLDEAAKQFEALLIGKMLQQTRDEGNGSFSGLGEEQGNSSIMEFAEQQMAQAISKQGGFGLARMVEHQLQPKLKPVDSSLPAKHWS